MMKPWLISPHIFSLITVLLLLTGCSVHFPFYYSASPIEGWIVDEETGKPLEDVIVVAQWILYDSKYRILPGSEGVLTAMETITDDKGYFYLPKWGPKVTFEGDIIYNAPKLTLFKSGYHWKELSNQRKLLKPGPIDYEREKQQMKLTYPGPKLYSDWHSKTIKLKFFKGRLEDYAAVLGGINESLVVLGLPQTYCGWKMIPNMVQALEQQRSIFETAKINSILRSVDLLAEISPSSCGSIHAFFKHFRSIRR